MMLRSALALPLILLTTAALAAPPPQPASAPSAEAPAASGERTVTLRFNGPLKQALREIAAQSGINLIATGALEREVEVVLQGTPGTQALETVAHAYSLKLQRRGSIWTMRPMTEAEAKAAAEEGEAPVTEPVAAARAEPQPAVPPGGAAPQELLGKLQRHSVNRADNDVTGMTVTVDEGMTVGDALAMGGDLTVLGHVTGDAVAFGGNVILGPAAIVDGDVTAVGGSIQKAETALVRGDEHTVGGKISRADVGSAVARQVAPTRARDREEEDWGVVTFLVQFTVLFGLGFLFMMFMPSRMKSVEASVRQDPLKALLTGFLATLAFLPLFIMLCASVIGIPIALALPFIAAVAVAMGLAAVANEIGVRLPLFRGHRTQALVLAMGLLLLLGVAWVPVVGGLALTVILLMGLGAVIRTRFGRPRGIPEPISHHAAPVG